ncbi:hypothetical protein JW899_03585 [Candidatus Uhrbacteria bacterium]|nr:hypothetical protein [Candidatus Uhrbacteria bacterium]
MSNKGLKLGLGEAHEMEITLRNAGWTKADIEKLTQNPAMAERFCDVLRGMATIELAKNDINLEAAPFVPEGWKICPEDQVKSAVRGLFRWRQGVIKLHLDERQKNWAVPGHDLHKVIEGQPVLSAHVLDYLLAHQELIPESWKGKVVFFWGTVYRSRYGFPFVRDLYWFGTAWAGGSYCLEVGFGSSAPAAVLAS